LNNADTHNLTVVGFTSGDEIFLPGTSIPKSKHVTLGSHGAGMVLNLTSTSSGVENTEKSAPAATSAASSSSAGISGSVAKASPDIAANLWKSLKMDFLGTALKNNTPSETHLDNANFALLLRDDFNEADIVGLNGAASSELTLTHPTIGAGAHITTLPLQTSIFLITTFSLG
jgi:hypothetical protein